MLRIGLMCVCLAGLTACVATPTGTNALMSESVALPESQLSLRGQADAMEARFHEAGWVAEEHGAAMQRLTGMLMFGRNEERRATPLEVYYDRAQLTDASAEARLDVAQADLAEATLLTQQLAEGSRRVLADLSVTAATLGDDLAALEYAISDTRQALSLFASVNEDTGGNLTSEVGELRRAFGGLSAAADGLAERRRELRDAPGS